MADRPVASDTGGDVTDPQSTATPPRVVHSVIRAAAVSVSVLFGLTWARESSYLLFHSLAELFRIVVACAIFIIAWNSRRFANNDYLTFLGIAYLAVASLDLAHTLAYKGMGVFPDRSANLPTQLWIAARCLEALSLLIAPAFIGRRLDARLACLGYAAIVALLLLLIFPLQVFPACYLEGVGLTAFKKVSEYVVCAVLLGATGALWSRRSQLEPSVLRLLIASILVTVAGELVFTLYAGPFDFFNVLGHYLKIISFYLIYRALIEMGLREPYSLLFRDLKQSQLEVQRHRDHLEQLVDERTGELREMTRRLDRAQEAERQNLARELHDQVAQDLTALSLNLSLIESIAPEEARSILAPRLQDAQDTLKQASSRIRDVMGELRPPALDEYGLLAALKWYCEGFASRPSRLTPQPNRRRRDRQA